MRLASLYIRTIIFLCISFVSTYANEDPLKIISPNDNRLQNELTLNVVIQTYKKNFDAIKITTPKGELEIDLDGNKSTHCKNVSLRLGENRITVRSYKNSVMLDEKIRRVYVTSELYHQYRYPDKKYVKSYFHNEKNEKLCATCHDMSVNEVEGVAFIDVTESNCYQCHKNLTKEKYAHAPAVNYLCTSCHKIKSKEEGHKYLMQEHVGESCFECHKENQELWDAAKYRHEPLDSGNCNKCHNPHSSPYNMFLRKPVNKICMGCHKDKHTRAIKDKNSACGNSDRKLCIKCHTPHATNQPFFLKKILKEKR